MWQEQWELYMKFCVHWWAGYLSRYSDWLRAGRSGDRIPVGARFSAPVQTGPGAHPASCTISTGSFPGVKSGRGVTLTPHPLLMSWSRNGRAIPLLLLWDVRTVQSLSACTGVNFTFFYLPMYVVISRWTVRRMLIKRSNSMQQYADIYLLQSHSTCFGHHSTHYQEY